MVKPLVVITGASSGIGLAVTRAFVAAGHAVLMVARHVAVPDDLAGPAVQCAEVDVADYDGLERAISAAEATYGGVGCVVNNAGIAEARALDQVAPTSYRRE